MLLSMTPRWHLISSSMTFSLQDLVDLSTNALGAELAELHRQVDDHIRLLCVDCRGKGRLCEVCRDEEDPLFLFDTACDGSKVIYNESRNINSDRNYSSPPGVKCANRRCKRVAHRNCQTIVVDYNSNPLESREAENREFGDIAKQRNGDQEVDGSVMNLGKAVDQKEEVEREKRLRRRRNAELETSDSPRTFGEFCHKCERKRALGHLVGIHK